MSAAPIQLAVVGHTNTGKTSLLRTLIRDTRFGEVSDRPATTRDVSGVALLLDDAPAIMLFDTPGLEDPIGLMQRLDALTGSHADPVARIDAFLAGDHGGGRFEQEAKVLRQLRRSDAALYVIDTRDGLLAKHREELRLLAQCGRPLLPVLNFIASAEAQPAQWRAGLARVGLHVLADFDTVLFEQPAERLLFDKLALLLEAQAPRLRAVAASREAQREALIAAACRVIAELLLDVAGVQIRVEADAAHASPLRPLVTQAEQRCVESLLALFRFDLDAWQPPQLPLQQGRWQLDPFDPEALRVFGIRTGSAITAGAVTGVSVDVLLGGASLGAGALIGAGAGTVLSLYQSHGRQWVDRLRGYQLLALDEATLALVAARQLSLLRALLRRGHASTQGLRTDAVAGWPSPELRAAVLRGRAHPQWSALNVGPQARPQQALGALSGLMQAIRSNLSPGAA